MITCLVIIFYSVLPNRQPRKRSTASVHRKVSVLPNRQPRNRHSIPAASTACVLPNRQPRIGQEESNLPAEQAVNNQNHQV